MSANVPSVKRGLPFVHGGLSNWCDRAVHGRSPFSEHWWCANRNAKECHCDCPCHWPEGELERRESEAAR